MLTEKKQDIFVGRRKTAVARVKLRDGTGKITVNKLPYEKYFTIPRHQLRIKEPLLLTNTSEKFDISATICGGGISGQADALRLAIARALVNLNSDLGPLLRKFKLLTRDPREKERKKYGRKRARKRFQYSKR